MSSRLSQSQAQVVPLNDVDEPVSKAPDRIASMFDAIAGRYDLLNHVLSAGIDRRWRTRAIRSLALTGRVTFAGDIAQPSPGPLDPTERSGPLSPAGPLAADPGATPGPLDPRSARTHPRRQPFLPEVCGLDDVVVDADDLGELHRAPS